MRLLLAATLLSLVPLAAQADPVRAEAETRTIDCAAGPAEVEGNRNTLTFTNACRSLRLRGEANTVQIELAPGAQIDVEGNGNRVRYTLPGGAAPPAVRVSGSNTDLAPDGAVGAAPPRAQTVMLTGDDQKLEIDCAGRAVSIQGNRSRYTLRGGCQSVSVHGDGNTVAAELRPDATVEIEGNGTSLAYSVPATGGDPQVTVRGNNSRASRSGEAERPKPAVASVAPTPAPPASPAPPAAQAPPATSADAGPSLPQLMHDLGAKVVAEGTLVAMPGDTLFGADPDQLRPEAAPRLTMLAQLAARIHPSGVRVSARAAETSVADRQSRAVGAWLTSSGQIHPPVRTRAATGPAGVDVLLLR